MVHFRSDILARLRLEQRLRTPRKVQGLLLRRAAAKKALQHEPDVVLLGGGASGCLQQGSHQLPEHHPGAGQGAACRCQQVAWQLSAVAAKALSRLKGQAQCRMAIQASDLNWDFPAATLAVGSSQSAPLPDQWSRRWARRQRRRRCRRASSVGSGSKTSERPA